MRSSSASWGGDRERGSHAPIKAQTNKSAEAVIADPAAGETPTSIAADKAAVAQPKGGVDATAPVMAAAWTRAATHRVAESAGDQHAMSTNPCGGGCPQN